MSAILFGSISTVVDTSELQREAYNQAFAQHGLDWTWDRDEYVDLLQSSGGQDRVAAYAKERGQDVDAAAVHATKSTIFQESLATAGLSPRPGVTDTIRDAHGAGQKVALVTTTSRDNISALLASVDDLQPGDFDLIVDSGTVEEPKPSAAAYLFALDNLGEEAVSCVAIEDNVGGVSSAVAAGVPVVAFPNANTAGHTFDGAASVVDSVTFDSLQGLASA